jgi:hypothetical protein
LVVPFIRGLPTPLGAHRTRGGRPPSAARRDRDGVSRDCAGGGRNPVITPLVGSDTASPFRWGRGAVCQRADCRPSDLMFSMGVVAAPARLLLPQPQLHVQV